MNRFASTFSLFVEDRAHEELLRPLVVRLAQEETIEAVVQVRSGRGGHGKAIREFKLYQELIDKGAVGDGLPDLVIVGIDGNCATFPKKRIEVVSATSQAFTGRVVAACPDPHIERWYLADAASFSDVVGVQPVVTQKKCERDYYKKQLSKAVQMAGHPLTLGGIEFARELAERIDWYRAGKVDRSFKAFVDDLRSGLKGLQS